MRLHYHKLLFSSYFAIIASLYCPLGKATDQPEIPIPRLSHPILKDEAWVLFRNHLSLLRPHISKCFQQLPEVFICYSSEEVDHREKVKALAQDLEEVGIPYNKILLDVQANPVGKGREVLEYVRQIKTARKVIVAGSPSLKRKYEAYDDNLKKYKQITAYELKLLLSKRKKSTLGLKGVIPLWFKDKAENCFPRRLTKIPYLDMTGDYAKYFLRDLMRALLSETPAIGAEDFLIDSHFLLFNKIRQQQFSSFQPAGSSTPQQSRSTQRLGFPTSQLKNVPVSLSTLVNLIDEEKLGKEKTQLLKQILELTKAELDEAERTRRQLKIFIKSEQFSALPSSLQKQLQNTQAKILSPEKLIWTDPRLGLLNSPSYDSLKPLFETIEELATLEHQLPSTKSITFLPLLQYYSAYLQKMLNVSRKKRKTLIQPKVLLTAEGLAEPSSEMIHFYRLSPRMAENLGVNDSSQNALRFQMVPSIDLNTSHQAASYWLAKLLFGRGIAPYLILAHHQPTADPQSREVRLIKSLQQIAGSNLKKYLNTNPQYTDIDLTSFSEHVLLSLLLQPAALLPENFSLQQITDTSFLLVSDPYAELFSQTNLVRNCNSSIQNILYYLPLMEHPIAPAVREKILSISSELFFLKWLAKLKQQEMLFKGLKDAPYEGACSLEMTDPQAVKGFKPGTLTSLIKIWKDIQLYMQDNYFISHNQLLNLLHPHLYQVYQDYLKRYSSPSLAFQQMYIDAEKDNDIKASLFNQILADGFTVEETAVEVWEGLNALYQPLILPYLELAVSAFPSILHHPSLHESWKHSSILHRALVEGASSEVVKFLLSLDMRLDWRHPQTQQTVFHAALQSQSPLNNLTLLQSKLAENKQEVFINIRDHQQLSPLDIAFNLNNPEAVIKLIDMDAYACKPELAASFYKKQSLSPLFTQAFKKLMRLNSAVEWHIALEELLSPVAPNAQAQGIILSSYGKRWIPRESPFKTVVEANGIHHRCVKRMTSHPYALYFKTYPALPGLEVSIGNFRRQLLGFGAPYVDLALFEGKPTLISQAIPGETLEYVLKTNPARLNNLDEEDLAGVIIDAMLTNPEDGQPANIIVAPHPTKPGRDQLIGVDNDQALVPAVVREHPQRNLLGKLVPTAQVKTILYCFDQMKKEIPENLRNYLLSIDPARFLQSWLEELKYVNARHATLFTDQQNMVKTLFDKHGCFIGIPFQKGAIRHLYEKFVQMQDLLSTHPSITLINLLAKLEPRLAKRYQGALYREISVLERFKEVEQPFYAVKKDGSMTTVTPSGCILQSMKIPLKEDTLMAIRQGKSFGPSLAIKELEDIIKQLNQFTLQVLGAEIGDAHLPQILELEASRAAFLKRLAEQSKTLTRQKQTAILAEIAKQTHLRELYFANFTTFDDTFIRTKLSLEHLRILDLRRCEKITNATLTKLAETALELEELNLGFLPQLKIIGDINYSQETSLIFNALHTLNLERCSNITKIIVQAPQLKWLNVSGCSQLTDEGLDTLIDHSTRLATLEFQDCPLITETEVRNQYPNYPASVLKEIDADPILEVLKQKDPELNLNGLRHIFHSGQIIFALNKALAIKPNLISLKLASWHLNAEEVRSLIQSNLSNLTELEIEKNNLGDAGAHALAQGTLSHLKKLYIGNNNIGETGARAIALGKFPSLINLNIDDNNIHELGTQAIAQGNLINLTTLYMERNKIGDAGAHALAQGNLSKLKRLYIGSNYIGKTGAQALAQGNFSHLTILNIRRNNIVEVGAHAITQGNLSNLTKLNIGCSNIDDAGAHALAQGNFSHLTSLNIGRNNISEAGVHAIAQGNFSHLINLNIWKNSIGEVGAQVLAQGNLSTLTKLNIADSNIGDAGARAIAQGNFSHLTNLNIGKNNIGGVGVKAITRGNLTNLTKLIIEKNNIGEVGAKALGQSNFSHPTRLSIAECNIGEAGAHAIAQGNLTYLMFLEIGWNNLEEAGAHAIAQGNLTNLRSLDLRWNNIGEAGAHAIAQGNLTNLTNLDLRWNNIGKTGAYAIAQGNFSNLKTLILNNNSITKEMENLLKSKFKNVHF